MPPVAAVWCFVVGGGSAVPNALTFNATVDSQEAGWDFQCACLATSDIYCWGRRLGCGQLGFRVLVLLGT